MVNGEDGEGFGKIFLTGEGDLGTKVGKTLVKFGDLNPLILVLFRSGILKAGELAILF